jgi:hypothetical protein
MKCEWPWKLRDREVLFTFPCIGCVWLTCIHVLGNLGSTSGSSGSNGAGGNFSPDGASMNRAGSTYNPLDSLTNGNGTIQQYQGNSSGRDKGEQAAGIAAFSPAYGNDSQANYSMVTPSKKTQQQQGPPTNSNSYSIGKSMPPGVNWRYVDVLNNPNMLK